MNFLLILLLFGVASQIDGFRANTNKGGLSKTGSKNAGDQQLNIGLIAPHTNFGKREYVRAINTAVVGLSKIRGHKFQFLEDYNFKVRPNSIHYKFLSAAVCQLKRITLIDVF